MAEASIAGGFYIGRDGRAHDADGNDLGVPLPESFPVRSVFVDQEGLLTVEQVCELEDLTEISGVGPSTEESVCGVLEDMVDDVGPSTRQAITGALERWGHFEEPEPDPDDDSGSDGSDGAGDGNGGKSDGEDGES